MELLAHVDFSHEAQTLDLVFDRCKKGREIERFDQCLIQHLKHYVATNIPLYINHQRSIDNTGLQAVDLFAWGIFKKHEDSDSKWFDIFQDRIKILLRK